MKGFTQKEVDAILRKHGCSLIGAYKNNKSKIKILCACGHERVTQLSDWRTWKQYKCKECIHHRRSSISNERRMNWKTELFIRKKMEKELQRINKYRRDFSPENYGKTKMCRICNREKPLYLFLNHSATTSGKGPYCKSCATRRSGERKQNWSQKQFIMQLINSCKNSNKRRNQRNRNNMAFSINIDDVEKLILSQNNRCVYSGNVLVWSSNHLNTASIDRIDSDYGYTAENIQLVTKTINAMKSDMTEETFLKMIDCIYETINKKRSKKNIWTYTVR